MILDDNRRQLLDAALDPQRVKSLNRGGRAASYIEAHDVIDTANRIFGYEGWSFELIDVQEVRAVDRDGAVTGSLFMAKGRLQVGDVVRVDIGTNDVTYAGEKSSRPTGYAGPDDYETAIKGAVSDCLKRCWRTFGNQFGNSLYDKSPGRAQRQQPAQQRQGGQAKAQPTEAARQQQDARNEPAAAAAAPAAVPVCPEHMVDFDTVGKKGGRAHRLDDGTWCVMQQPAQAAS